MNIGGTSVQVIAFSPFWEITLKETTELWILRGTPSIAWEQKDKDIELDGPTKEAQTACSSIDRIRYDQRLAGGGM